MSEDYDRKIVDDIIEAHAKQRGLNKMTDILREATALGKDVTEDDVKRIIQNHNLSPQETIRFFRLLVEFCREHNL